MDIELKDLNKPDMGVELCEKVFGPNIKKLKKWIIILVIILVTIVVCIISSSVIAFIYYITKDKKKDKFESISKYDENNKYINS